MKGIFSLFLVLSLAISCAFTGTAVLAQGVNTGGQGYPVSSQQDPLDTNIQNAEAQEALQQSQLKSIEESKKSVEEQIDQLKKSDQSGPGHKSSPEGAKRLALLETLLSRDNASEQQHLSQEKLLEQWIQYWTSLKQTISWNQEQDRIDAVAAQKNLVSRTISRQNRAETRAGTAYWKQINTPPAGSGVTYDGWTSIPLPER
jgi:hypothetical protein